MSVRADEIGSVGIAGAGMIGRSWGLVFARAGCDVRLWDADPAQVERALAWSARALAEMAEAGLVDDPAEIRGRIAGAATLEDVAATEWVQENTSEVAAVKAKVFAALDAAAPPDTILASSSSSLGPSAFASECAGRRRCLLVHPVNPPHLVPLVEILGGPWTEPEVVETAMAFMRRVGQVPVEVGGEIPGFILNRLQGALLDEAFRLVESGHASAEAVDACLVHGLAMRWSFIGPFETIDLNAPGGVGDYVERYGQMYFDMNAQRGETRPWDAAAVARIVAERRERLPLEDLPERQAWRDRELMRRAAARKSEQGA